MPWWLSLLARSDKLHSVAVAVVAVAMLVVVAAAVAAEDVDVIDKLAVNDMLELEYNECL